MSEHTEGPWGRNQFLVYAENGNGCTLATINSTSRGISDVEAEANARLISAAPELLAACKEALDCATCASPSVTNTEKRRDSVIANLTTAIAKATE